MRVPGRQPRARHSRPRPRPPTPGARPPPTPVPAPRTDLSPARLPGPHPLPARPPPALPAPPGARQSRSRGDSPAAAAPVPASPPHPGAGGASGSSQSKSRAPRSARVRRRLWARVPQAASQEEASIGRQLSPASSAWVSILPPPAQAEPGTSLPGLAFPPGQGGGEDAERLPARQASNARPAAPCPVGRKPGTGDSLRAPAGCPNALPNLRGKELGGGACAPKAARPTTGSVRRRGAGTREQGGFCTWARGPSRGCGPRLPGGPGWSVQ